MKKFLLLLAITTCNTLFSQIVFNENWDGIGPGISGWTLYNQDGLTPNASVAFVNAAWVASAEEFDNKVAISTSWYTPAGTSNDWLVSPSITVPTGTTTLYWDAKAYDPTFSDAYKVLVSTTTNAVANFTTTLLTQGNGTSTGENAIWTRRSLNLSAYAGQTIYLAFQNFSNDLFLLGVDNVSIVNNNTCLAPERTIATSNITTSGATISWNAVIGASSYDIAIGTPGYTPSAPSFTTNSPSYTFTGLMPNTRYQYYVRNSCGSMWIGPYSLFTANTLPYTQGFENTTANGGFNVEGWSTIGWSIGTAVGGAQAGSQYVFRNSSTTAATNAWLFTRPLRLSNGEQVVLNFYTRLGGTGTAHSLKVSVAGTNLPADHTNVLSTLNITGTTYTLQTVNFTATTAGTYYFGFNNVTPAVATVTSLRLDSVNLTSTLLSSDSFIASTFNVYPNPVNDIISISSNAISFDNVSLSDINGRVVKTINFNAVSEFNLNVSDLTSGIYFLKIKTSEGTLDKKIIKN